jgi:hypothetical protein
MSRRIIVEVAENHCILCEHFLYVKLQAQCLFFHKDLKAKIEGMPMTQEPCSECLSATVNERGEVGK